MAVSAAVGCRLTNGSEVIIMTSGQAGTAVRTPAAERIMEAASRLFYERGIRAVGVDTIAAEANVTKVTLYKHFGSKDGLVAAHLHARDERWRELWREIADRHEEPSERLLAVFDAYEQWLVADNFRGCAFVNASAEIADTEHPARVVTDEHKAGFRRDLAAMAARAGHEPAEKLADELLVLLEGATVTAALRRNSEPLRLARDIARRMLGMTADVPSTS